MPSAATWMNLEITILSEVKSERKRQIPYDIIYMRNLKYDTDEFTYKTETDSNFENKVMVTEGGRWEGRNKLRVWD